MLKSIFRQGHRSTETDAATKLLQTLSDSYSIEERLRASSDLKNALLDNSSSKSTVSSFGLEVICNAIRNDWKEEEVVRNCLESLAIVIDTSYSENFAECRVNAEQLVRTPGALSLLFDSLEYSEGSGNERFHIKYFSLQVLKSLFEANQAFCQQASLKLPNSLSAPVKLLKDQEVLRNDSILLLQSLVFRSKSAQDSAIRSGCLDTLFNIYENEDPHLNYAVIEDSMILLRYILESNLDAQAIFCSSDKFERFLRHFQTRISNANSQISIEQSRILASEIGIIFSFLVSRCVPNSLKSIMYRNGSEERPVLVTWLLSLAQIHGKLSDFSFASAAWDCLLELSKFSSIREDIISSKIDIQGQAAPIQLGSLYIALTSHDAIHQMSSMRFCVRTLWRDEAMQDQCIRQLFSSSNLGALLFGQTNTLFDLLLRSRCLMCLAPLSMRTANREKLQSITNDGHFLISLCSEILSKTVLHFGKVAEASEICLNCSIFAACITQDSPQALGSFLQSISEKPFLVGVLLSESQFGDNENIIKGVCSLLLGLCLNAPEVTGIDPKLIEETIKDKVGLSNFMAHLNFLEGQVSDLDKDYLFGGIIPTDIFKLFTHKVKSRFYPTSIEKNNAAERNVPEHNPSDQPRNIISREITSNNSGIAIDELQKENTELRNKLQQQNKELSVTQEKLRKVEDDLQALSQAYSSLDEYSNDLRERLEASKIKDLSGTMDDSAIEDLLVCLGQEEEKNARLVAHLQSLGISMDQII